MVATMHRVHIPNVGEGIIHKPGGTPYTYEDIAKYPYGSFLQLGNKGFVYAKAKALLDTSFGAIASKPQKMGYMVTAAKVLEGALIVTITVTATQNIGEDELAGGELMMFANTINVFNRGIVSNTAIVTSGTMTVVMDSPSPCEVAAGSGVEAMISPYANVVNSTAPAGGYEAGWYHMVLGMPTVPAPATKSLWLQVTGPCWVVPDVLVGAEEGDIEVVFGANGSISIRDATQHVAGKLNAQHAGYIMASAVGGGGGQGAPFIMLDIAH